MSDQHFPDSEMLYVSNDKTWHAYNLLLWEDENGEIKKQYFDLTRKIEEGKTKYDQDEIQEIDHELWSKNKQDSEAPEWVS